VQLPSSACVAGSALYADGFETESVLPHDPSNGTGGATGNSSGSAVVSGYPVGTYYLHVPASYGTGPSMPVMVALHGYVGSHTAALAAAQQIRTDWSALADANGFIVLVPVSNDAQGGWSVPASAADYPTDYDLIAAALADVENRYNIERTRRYGWGFSAGAHVMHDLMLNGFNAAVNAERFAGYGVSSGTLRGRTCMGLTRDQCGTILAQARKIPFDSHVGDVDPNAPYARDDYALFQEQGWVGGANAFYSEFPGGHTYQTSHLAQVWSRVCRYAVTP
jgi:poly(3-hydroxybutyrate) depolymerase